MDKGKNFLAGQPVAGVTRLAAVSGCVGRLLRRLWNVGIGHEKLQSQTISPGKELERGDFSKD